MIDIDFEYLSSTSQSGNPDDFDVSEPRRKIINEVFLLFENEKSIYEKVNYIKEKNLDEALIWVINGDYGKTPNYVKSLTNINEGKYTFGNTLTERLKEGLDKIFLYTKTDEYLKDIPEICVEANFSVVYYHPNYTYNLKLTFQLIPNY